MGAKLAEPQIGTIFGHLKYVGAYRSREGRIVCDFLCGCGVTVTKPLTRVICKNISFCSNTCPLCRLNTTTLKTTHGLCQNSDPAVRKTYQAWCHIKSRCYNPQDKEYVNYGGRGIAMYGGWINDAQAFFDYLGPAPGLGRGWSVDRHPNNESGNYEPGNVRWATCPQQSRGKRNNRMLTAFGETFCLTDWARLFGVNRNSISRRLDKPGRTLQETLVELTGTNLLQVAA